MLAAPPDSRWDIRPINEQYRVTDLPTSANPGQLRSVEPNGGILTNDAYDRNAYDRNAYDRNVVVDGRRDLRQTDDQY